ncbi:MAG: DNA ligase (NAD(+)) LigA, partial [Malacoplasma sp.]|nr:DNA ligase (NAD(+)) LigA [Malacoplasma sp.]
IQDAIEKSKSNSLEKLLMGLGIRDVGAISALSLAKHFKNIDALMIATKEDLVNLKDVGEVVSTSIYDWTHNQSNIDLIKKLKEVGVNTTYINSAESLNNINSPFYQKNFCITGSFDISREQIKEKLIAKFDANVSNSVNKSTDYLIVGENGGSKQEKAEKLNIKIIRDKIWEDN